MPLPQDRRRLSSRTGPTNAPARRGPDTVPNISGALSGVANVLAQGADMFASIRKKQEAFDSKIRLADATTKLNGYAAQALFDARANPSPEAHDKAMAGFDELVTELKSSLQTDEEREGFRIAAQSAAMPLSVKMQGEALDAQSKLNAAARVSLTQVQDRALIMAEPEDQWSLSKSGVDEVIDAINSDPTLPSSSRTLLVLKAAADGQYNAINAIIDKDPQLAEEILTSGEADAIPLDKWHQLMSRAEAAIEVSVRKDTYAHNKTYNDSNVAKLNGTDFPELSEDFWERDAIIHGVDESRDRRMINDMQADLGAVNTDVNGATVGGSLMSSNPSNRAIAKAYWSSTGILDGVKYTTFGYAGDPHGDKNSKNGIGHKNNKLRKRKSIALSKATAASLGIRGKEQVAVGVTYKDGTREIMVFDDTIPSDYGEHRVDIYDPDGPGIRDGQRVKLELIKKKSHHLLGVSERQAFLDQYSIVASKADSLLEKSPAAYFLSKPGFEKDVEERALAENLASNVPLLRDAFDASPASDISGKVAAQDKERVRQSMLIDLQEESGIPFARQEIMLPERAMEIADQLNKAPAVGSNGEINSDSVLGTVMDFNARFTDPQSRSIALSQISAARDSGLATKINTLTRLSDNPEMFRAVVSSSRGDAQEEMSALAAATGQKAAILEQEIFDTDLWQGYKGALLSGGLLGVNWDLYNSERDALMGVARRALMMDNLSSSSRGRKKTIESITKAFFNEKIRVGTAGPSSVIIPSEIDGTFISQQMGWNIASHLAVLLKPSGLPKQARDGELTIGKEMFPSEMVAREFEAGITDKGEFFADMIEDGQWNTKGDLSGVYLVVPAQALPGDPTVSSDFFMEAKDANGERIEVLYKDLIEAVGDQMPGRTGGFPFGGTPSITSPSAAQPK